MKIIDKIQNIYQKIIDYFMSGVVNDSYIKRQKAFAFVVINLAGIALNLFFIIVNLIFNSKTNLWTNLFGFLILFVDLILIKKAEFKFASNFFILSLIILFIINLFAPSDEIVLSEYINEFYFLFSILVLSLIFATDLIIIISAVSISIGTLSFYLLNINNYTPQMQLFAKSAIINYQFALFIITVILISTSRIIRKNVDYAEKQSKLADIQKDKAINAFTTVSMTSDTMHEMSTIINELTGTLNQSTNKQAVNIEEMSSTIEILNQSIVTNAEYASMAAKSSGERTMVVRRSERLLKRVISSIVDISTRISFIQDIARQTNIISLNASIEAARAGRSGRGFAAVANGIKKLAEQSQRSAKDIISLVNEGLSVSDQANDYLSAIVENSEKTTELMNGISEALMEQINNITQINIGMSEINNSAQTNASIVDDLATNVEIMKQNAEIQRDLFQEESKGM